MEANQLAILQAWSRLWTRGYSEQIQLAVRAGLELGASESQVQRCNRSATLPPFPKFSLNLPSFDNCKTSHRSIIELHYIWMFKESLTIWLLTGMLRVVWLANLTNKVGRTYTLDVIDHNGKKYGTEYCPLRHTSVDCHVVSKNFIPHNPLLSFTLKLINQLVTCGPEPTLYSLLQIK